MFCFIDIGTKNFCYIICTKEKEQLYIYDFDVIKISKNTIDSTISFLYSMKNIDSYYIEKQVSKNTKCKIIETVIITYCKLKNINFNSVNAKGKNKLLKDGSQNYYFRKKDIVKTGEKYLESIIKSDNIKKKITELTKKDDFYDCLLMALTELQIN